MTFALYIHYPFCTARCPYCGFATQVAQDDQVQRCHAALLRELHRAATADRWRRETVSSIYLGGGTPSLIPPEFLRRLTETIDKAFGIPDGIEFTLEANPESTDIVRLRDFRNCGVNRLSIGAQSFLPAELKLLGRRHTTDDAAAAVSFARDAGFDNVSVDLIYGAPGQTAESVTDSVRRALELGVDHISTYTLSIEESTPFAERVRRGTLAPPDPDRTADQYKALVELLREAGFEHYELTNYARPGMWSRHNFAYWNRTPYLGLGPGAHSFDGDSRRWWNCRDLERYLKALEAGTTAVEGREALTEVQVLQERVYLGLRTRDGIPEELHNTLDLKTVEELVGAGLLADCGSVLHIPESSWLLLDEIVLQVLPGNPS